MSTGLDWNAESGRFGRMSNDRSRTWMRYTDSTPCAVDGCDESFHLSIALEYHHLREHTGL